MAHKRFHFFSERCDCLSFLSGGTERVLEIDFSPIRTVIVSQGDVNDFHHFHKRRKARKHSKWIFVMAEVCNTILKCVL